MLLGYHWLKMHFYVKNHMTYTASTLTLQWDRRCGFAHWTTAQIYESNQVGAKVEMLMCIYLHFLELKFLSEQIDEIQSQQPAKFLFQTHLNSPFFNAYRDFHGSRFCHRAFARAICLRLFQHRQFGHRHLSPDTALRQT